MLIIREAKVSHSEVCEVSVLSLRRAVEHLRGIVLVRTHDASWGSDWCCRTRLPL